MEGGGKEGQVVVGEGMVLDHQADGGSVGGQRCNGCKRTKNQNQEDSRPPDLLFFFPSHYHYGKKSTYLYALFSSPTRPVPVSGDVLGCHTWRKGGDATASRG